MSMHAPNQRAAFAKVVGPAWSRCAAGAAGKIKHMLDFHARHHRYGGFSTACVRRAGAVAYRVAAWRMVSSSQDTRGIPWYYFQY